MRHLILIVVVGIAMAVAAPAFAGGGSVLSGHTSQPPASQALNTKQPKPKPNAGNVAGTSNPTVKSTGTLPFTGLNLAFAAAAGVVLVGAGALLRRTGRSER